VAEGVETEAQQNMLKSMGCQQVQGYLYGAPMPAESLQEKLTNVRDKPRQTLSFFNTENIA